MTELLSILWADYLLAAKEYQASPSLTNWLLAQAQFDAYFSAYGERVVQ